MGRLATLLAGLFPPRLEDLSRAPVGRIITVPGEVAPRDLIESPLTGDRCVYYRYSIEEYREPASGNLGMGGFWEIIDRDEAITEFYLKSGADRAIVSPRQVLVESSRSAAEPIDLGGIHNRRAQELTIRPGDRLEITARVDVADDLFDEGRDYRSSPRRLMLRAPEGRRLKLRLLPRNRAGAERAS